MPEKKPSWKFVPVELGTLSSWGYGQVSSVQDLYSQQIFGAAQDLRCSCGRYAGVEYLDKTCIDCRVTVEADSAGARKRRVGLALLATHCEHPVFGFLMRYFPVIPVAFRVDESGLPNPLGLKYEKLIEVNARLTARLGARGSDQFDERGGYDAQPELDSALADLFQPTRASPDDRSRPDQPRDISSLFELLHGALRRLDPNIDVIAVSCGMALEISLTV